MNKETLKFLSEILKDLLDGTISFHDANQKITKSEYTTEEKRRFVSYLGAVLRNYISLNAVANSYFSHLPKQLRNILLIGMVILRFGRVPEEKEATKEIISLLFRDFELENFLFSLKNLFTFLESDLRLVPSDARPNSIEYFSMIYNIPPVLLKMWVKQYSFQVAIKCAAAYNRRLATYYRLNTNKTTIDDALAAGNGIIKKTQFDNIVSYEAKIPFRQSRFYSEFLLFKTNLGIYKALHEIDFNNMDALLYFSDESVFPQELFLAFQEKGGKSLDVLASRDELKYPLLQKAANLRKVKQYVRVSSFDGLEANLHKKYQRVFFFAESTKFDDISSRPELLIRLDLNKLTQYGKDQLEGLNALSAFVDPYGQLIYLVPTLSKKESNRIVEEFLRLKPEFKLIKEEQIYPFEKGGSTLYYAILQKEPLSENGEV